MKRADHFTLSVCKEHDCLHIQLFDSEGNCYAGCDIDADDVIAFASACMIAAHELDKTEETLTKSSREIN